MHGCCDGVLGRKAPDVHNAMQTSLIAFTSVFFFIFDSLTFLSIDDRFSWLTTWRFAWQWWIPVIGTAHNPKTQAPVFIWCSLFPFLRQIARQTDYALIVVILMKLIWAGSWSHAPDPCCCCLQCALQLVRPTTAVFNSCAVWPVAAVRGDVHGIQPRSWSVMCELPQLSIKYIAVYPLLCKSDAPFEAFN